MVRASDLNNASMATFRTKDKICPNDFGGSALESTTEVRFIVNCDRQQYSFNWVGSCIVRF